MDLVAHIREAFSNLFSAKLRSILAILGVLVGTGSVVALISSSQLATAHALAQFKALGTNLIAVMLEENPDASKTMQKKQLKFDMMPEIDSASSEIVESAPYTMIYQQLRFAGQNFQGQTIGATESLANVVKITLNKGRFISQYDANQYYCVIGKKIADQIQALGMDPMNQQLQIGTTYFTIIGVLQDWPPNFFLFADINQSVVIPLATSYYLGKDVEINNVLFRLIQNPNIDLVQQQLTARLGQLLPNKRIEIRNPNQIIDIVAKQRATFTWLLAAIGGISLIVGGIGVMNIMLVSVVERRREIGVRMAIGAKRKDILQMFLIESIFLTIFGGILGIIIGVIISYILALVTGWEFQLFLLPPLLGFVVSALVGMISGFYPAYRASRLDPIQTLQAE